ncbi:hypothetical protein RRG08_020493 [Elysia crispata]|uniref:Uncharacterized protein n=1 Tax=Elysia crispata TaxID=231223 RepID=A0AAE0ZGX3_9GAST|nr:hypothetical protein RRG08_020493 [Elysia crispata]
MVAEDPTDVWIRTVRLKYDRKSPVNQPVSSFLSTHCLELDAADESFTIWTGARWIYLWDYGLVVSDPGFPAFVVLSGVNVPSPRRNLNKICGRCKSWVPPCELYNVRLGLPSARIILLIEATRFKLWVPPCELYNVRLGLSSARIILLIEATRFKLWVPPCELYNVRLGLSSARIILLIEATRSKLWVPPCEVYNVRLGLPSARIILLIEATRYKL